MDSFGFPWGKAIYAWIAMETNVYSFEQFMRAVARGGQQPAAVGGEATNESVNRMVATNRARICIRRRNRSRQVDLSAGI
jgi:hypothetical protein